MSVNPIIKQVAFEVAKKCNPFQVYLVSEKKNYKNELTGCKLCVIVDDEYNPSELEATLLIQIDCPVPFDYIVYNITDWNDCLTDDCSFAYRVENLGVVLYEQGKS